MSFDYKQHEVKKAGRNQHSQNANANDNGRTGHPQKNPKCTGH